MTQVDSEGGAPPALTSSATGVLSVAALDTSLGAAQEPPLNAAWDAIPELELPLSKSIWNRLQVLHAVLPDRVDLSDWPEVGVSFDSSIPESALYIEEAGIPEDVLAMARVVEAVRLSCETDTWQQVDVGPAGTAWRFGLALALATPGAKVVLEGHARLQERPIAPLVKALTALGAELEGGVPPHRCRGRRLRGGPCTLDASASSQHLSALLLIAPLLEEPLTVHLTAPLVSAPYAHMTAALLRRVGYSVSADDTTWQVQPSSHLLGGALPNPVVFERDPDWSAAAVHGAVAALTGKPVLLRHLRTNSLQGDRAVGTLLANLGVRMESVLGGIQINASQGDDATPANATSHPGIDHNSPLDWDFSKIPDTVQPLLAAAMALGKSGKAVGLHTLAGKEINRMNGLLELAEVLGVSCTADADSFTFSPGPNFRPRQEATHEPGLPQHRSAHGDHRQAFAWALVGLRVPVVVSDPDCVRKSYPDFWRNFSVHVGA